MLKHLRLAKARFHLLLGRVLTGMGLGLSLSASQGLAQTSASAVPQSWMSYAQRISMQLQHCLSDTDNPAALRLQSWMQERHSHGWHAASPLQLQVWVTSSGQIARLEFETLGQVQADEDLRRLLTSAQLQDLPPHDLRQPLLLALDSDLVP
ncbi:hypothetical protein F3J24_21625 [Comamonas sp. Tr-654]|uniref:hypothetical protein n=1 Tax=Comamonas sp. Tr-654 TaxID=2608341 RepID=UPI00142171A7|nr:hypothetical protein [Comamonas sp. Tr-654]NIF86082.1 hypothetical protein [Comamonas sp. Tr-654]